MRLVAITRTIAVAVCVLVSSGGVLRADDVKAYHGAFCQYDGDDVQGAFYDEEGASYITSSTSRVFTCPLIRDRWNSSSSINSVYIEGFNESTVSAFSCTLISQSEDISGTTLDSHQLSQSAANAVTLGAFTVDTSGGNEGSYAVLCLLDDGDRLFHIYVNESTSASE
jgi:hypothetical protein